jgi:hypothetical protein
MRVMQLVGFGLMTCFLVTSVLFGFSTYATYPSMSGTSLVEVRGAAHAIVQLPPPRRGNSVVSFEVDGYPGRFWTDAVSSVPVEWGQRPVIRVWIPERHSFSPQADGSRKTYGLWINGKELVSPSTRLEAERENVQMGKFFLSALGIIGVYSGFRFVTVMRALRRRSVAIPREPHLGRGR